MFDVPVEAEVLQSVIPPVNGEDVVFVFALASEMPPGATGVVVGAGAPNVGVGFTVVGAVVLFASSV